MPATVLCVDDDRHLCQILEKALVREGYRVQTAYDGDEALARLRAEAPSLVLLDVLLPRRDGFEVLEEIRAMHPPESQTPVLMITGCRITPQYQERAESLGAAAILAKPVALETLLQLVREHVKDAPPRVSASAGGSARTSRARTPSRNGPRPPLRGTFQELGFPHLLHHLHGLRATGVLMLSNGKKRKALQLRDGYPVAVKSNLVGECLGNMLMRDGTIDDACLRESLQRVKKGEGLQGQILVAMEVLSEEEVGLALRRQAEEKLFEVFEWGRGAFQFEIGGRLKSGSELAIGESPANLILRGVRERMPLGVIDAYLSERAGRFVVAGESAFYRHQDVDLSAPDRGLLQKLGSGRRLSDLARSGEAMRRTLFALLAIELVDLRDAATGAPSAEPRPPEPAAAAQEPGHDPARDRALRAELAARAERLRGQSYFEILGVDEEADEQAVSAAFDAVAQQVHPDRYSNASSAVRQLAEEVHQLVLRAHETISDPRRRREYVVERKKDERLAAQQAEGRRALEAEIEFQKGEANLRTRDYEIALRYFGEALSRYPEEGEYHAYYGWCLYLCHPDDVTIAQEAIEHVKRAVKLARDREKPYLFLGRLYKAVGKNAMAEKMFTRAVQISPDCVEAMRELRLINLRREKGKGLVRRLLRR